MLDFAGKLAGLRQKTETDPLADDAMLKAFLCQLVVRANFFEYKIGENQRSKQLLGEVVEDIKSLYGRFKGVGETAANDAWNEAYRLERTLALIEPAETLVDEVRRKLAEAEEEKIPSTERLRAVHDTLLPELIDKAQPPPSLKPGGEMRLRDMLLDILEETHWNVQRKFYSRPIKNSATRRIASLGLMACALFILPFLYLYVRSWWFEGKYDLPLGGWAWLPLWTALTAGFFGAMFSRLLFLMANWNSLSLGALKDTRAFTSILLRGSIGMTGAVVVYYFLLSGVIAGELFPKFDEIALKHLLSSSRNSEGNQQEYVVPLRLILPNAQLALLAVWSFIAGFSERLVPNILQTTESSLQGRISERKLEVK